MSAERARHGTDHPTAAVIAFPQKASRSRHSPRRERTRVPEQSRPGPDLTPQQKLAAWLEGQFAKYGRTLTDEDTAEGMRITLAAYRTVLEGALKQGKISEDAHRDLDAMVEGMMAAPGLLA